MTPLWSCFACRRRQRYLDTRTLLLKAEIGRPHPSARRTPTDRSRPMNAWQELIECFSMREALAAQLKLLTDQPDVYEEVLRHSEGHRCIYWGDVFICRESAPAVLMHVHPILAHLSLYLRSHCVN